MIAAFDDSTSRWRVVDDDGTIVEDGFATNAQALRWADDHTRNALAIRRARIHNDGARGSRMYVGSDFNPSDTGENERYTLDFLNDLQRDDAIASVEWTCKVAAKSAGDDPDAANCISGRAVFEGTKTTQRVHGMKLGVIYCLTAVVVTEKGDTVSLWSHVECRGPR
jgi:hypothetical protein